MARRPGERTRTWNLPYVQELIQTYENAQAVIGRKITQRRRIGNLTRYQEAILADVELEIARLNRYTANFAKEHGPINYKQGAMFIQNWLKARELQFSPFDERSNLHTNAVQIIVQNITDTFSNANNFMGRRVEDSVRAAGLRAASLQLTAGQTISETRNFLVQELADRGFESLTDRSGRKWQLSTYSQMVARTTAIEAINTGRFNKLREDDYDLVKMTQHFGACPICGPLEGRVYSISGNNRDYPALYDTALARGFDIVHPNCAHTFTPYISRFDDNEERTRSFSNRPIDMDARSKSSKEAFQRSQVRRRELTRDRKQYAQYRAILGDGAPKSLSAFRRMKGADSEKWKETRKEYLRRKNLARKAIEVANN